MTPTIDSTTGVQDNRRGSISVRTRLVTMIAFIAVTLGMTLAAAPPASANPTFTVGAVTHNCGIASCSVYISRSGTQSLDRFFDSRAGRSTTRSAKTATCRPLRGVPYVGLPLSAFCSFRFTQFDRVLDDAAAKNRCFKVTYLRNGVVTHISTNNGQYCKN